MWVSAGFSECNTSLAYSSGRRLAALVTPASYSTILLLAVPMGHARTKHALTVDDNKLSPDPASVAYRSKSTFFATWCLVAPHEHMHQHWRGIGLQNAGSTLHRAAGMAQHSTTHS